jgi:threonylcarbamoyladenosine tRNA methylthiotransferase MtaB
MSNVGRVAYETLGCKLNFSETSMLASTLTEAGFARVTVSEGADVVVVNTCSVTDHADSKCRNIVRRALAANPDAYVAVIGCYAQLKPEEIAAIDGVDLVLGAAEKFDLPGLLAERLGATADGSDVDMGLGDGGAEIRRSEIKAVTEFFPAVSRGDRTRSFLKVQDGCNYFCAFCTIPLARGRSRSGTIAQTVLQAQKAVDAGAREIVLTGVNIGDFGAGTDENLLGLLRALEAVQGVDRFRISSIEPNLLTEDIISWVAESERFQPHFHIPLQSGSDEVLSAMRRRYRTDEYRRRVEHIHSLMPTAGIGVDVIVGFPGESQAQFDETARFLADLPVSYLHVFTYSERAKTTALRIDEVVPVPERKRRNAVLRTLSLKKQRAHAEQFVGLTRAVLFEDAVRDGLREGYTPEYVRVGMDAELCRAGELVDVRLEEMKLGLLQATRVNT